MVDIEGGGFAVECVAADTKEVGAGRKGEIKEGREEAYIWADSFKFISPSQ